MVAKKRQQKFFRKFCVEVEGVKETSRLYRVIARGKNLAQGNVRMPSGVFTEDGASVRCQFY